MLRRGEISRFEAVEHLQPRTSIEFSTLAVFVRPGCKPTNPVRPEVRTFWVHRAFPGKAPLIFRKK